MKYQKFSIFLTKYRPHWSQKFELFDTYAESTLNHTYAYFWYID